MGINKAIRDVVYTNMIMDESPKFSYVENQISVFDLWKVQKDRNVVSKNCFFQQLDSQAQYIDFAYFQRSWKGVADDHAICMNFFLKKVGPVVCEKPVFVSIEYRDGQLSLLHESMLELELLKGSKVAADVKRVEEAVRLFKDIMFNELRESLIKIACFGLANHYNKEPKLNTVSHEFGVGLDNSRLSLSFSSDIIDKARRDFYLTYYYNWESQTISSRLAKHYIESRLGPWSLQTNIPFMKSLLMKSMVDDNRTKVGNGIDALCHNLKVDYDLLPKYLQDEVVKVKSLK